MLFLDTTRALVGTIVSLLLVIIMSYQIVDRTVLTEQGVISVNDRRSHDSGLSSSSEISESEK